MINGIKIKELRVIPDERGRVMEILRRDDDIFLEFGQVYMTTTYPGVVKAWHKHEKQADNIVCVSGMIKMALHDQRTGSPTRGETNEFYLGVHNPVLIQVPPGVYHGWMAVSQEEAIIINIPSKTYDREHPDEQRLDPHDNDIPYDWRRRDS